MRRFTASVIVRCYQLKHQSQYREAQKTKDDANKLYVALTNDKPRVELILKVVIEKSRLSLMFSEGMWLKQPAAFQSEYRQCD